MGFLRPWVFMFLPPVLAACWILWRKRIRPEFHWPAASVISPENAGKISIFRLLRIISVWIMGLAFILLASGFYKGEVVNKGVVEKYTIVFLQDRSGSMLGFLQILADMTKMLMETRSQDRFCGVYFSSVAVSTACGESVRVLAEVADKDLDRSYGSDAMGRGTEVGSGLLMALKTVLYDANKFSAETIGTMIASLEAGKTPLIEKDKLASHYGYVLIAETDADFSDKEWINPVHVINVMRDLGVRVYFIILTQNRPEKIIAAVRETGGESYNIGPAFTSDQASLREELRANFKDIDTLIPVKSVVVKNIEPRVFLKEIGAVLALLSVVYALSFVADEIRRIY